MISMSFARAVAQFTAPDLSAIARNLDMLEATYDHDNRGAESSNMDDTGMSLYRITVFQIPQMPRSGVIVAGVLVQLAPC